MHEVIPVINIVLPSRHFDNNWIMVLVFIKYVVFKMQLLDMKAWVPRNSRPKVFCKKVVLRNFVKSTGKHLSQSLFLDKVAGLRHWKRKLSIDTILESYQSTVNSVVLNTMLRKSFFYNFVFADRPTL